MYDLNVEYGPDIAKCLAILQDLGYKTVAVNVKVTQFPTECPIPRKQLQERFPKLKILTRVTVILNDKTQNQPISKLVGMFDLLAVRPMTEKAFQSACSSMDIDIISFDLKSRTPFLVRHGPVAFAQKRGIFLEITYGSAINSESRANTITNVTAFLRVSRMRGLLLTSGASLPILLRAPSDVINLAIVWGFNSNSARDALTINPELAVKSGYLRNHSYKQVVMVEPEVNNSIKSASSPSETYQKGDPIGSPVSDSSVAIKRTAKNSTVNGSEAKKRRNK